MLTLALMAEIAALVVADYGSVMELLVGRQDQAQSRWLARGAIDWARNVLSEDARTTPTDHLGEIWATRIPPTQVEDGEVSGEISDYSGFFDVNSLVVNGVVVTEQVEAYKRLLRTLGLPPGEVASLAASLVDWLDSNVESVPGGAETAWYADSGRRYRTANAPLLDIDELHLIRGYQQDVVSRLRKVAVALPEPATLNVNTAGPEVLVAVVTNLSIDDARVLVAKRTASPFDSIAAFKERLPPGATPPADSLLAIKSRYFLAGGRAKYGQAVTRMEVLLDRKSNWSEIVWQKVL